MNIKAMVTKIDRSNNLMVVFTEDRRFIKLPLPPNVPNLGATIQVNLQPEKKLMHKLLTTKWFTAAAVFLLVLAAGLYTSLGISPVAAYVNLDMKPRLQLSVNEQGKVTGVTALNQEAKQLLDRVDTGRQDLYQIVKDIMEAVGNQGYLEPQKQNLVMASVTNLQDSSNYQVDQTKLRSIIQEALISQHYSGYIVMNKTGLNQWQRARQAGQTVNEYLVSERAREKGITLTPRELDDSDLMQVLEKSNLPVPMLFPENTWEVSQPGEPVSPQQGGDHPNSSSAPNQFYEENHYGSSRWQQQSQQFPKAPVPAAKSTHSTPEKYYSKPNQSEGHPADSGAKDAIGQQQPVWDMDNQSTSNEPVHGDESGSHNPQVQEKMNNNQNNQWGNEDTIGMSHPAQQEQRNTPDDGNQTNSTQHDYQRDSSKQNADNNSRQSGSKSNGW
ncbi:MAG: anti-sigma factor domain-containing protein [Clostridia bacterium]|nr:anti-sigma factor domain-containing protein [Clostridia bacterium]